MWLNFTQSNMLCRIQDVFGRHTFDRHGLGLFLLGGVVQ